VHRKSTVGLISLTISTSCSLLMWPDACA
jgi:hypothetical protein